MLTQPQFYKIIIIYDECSGIEASIRADDFIEAEGKKEAFRIWAELKLDEIKRAEQATTNSAAYNMGRGVATAANIFSQMGNPPPQEKYIFKDKWAQPQGSVERER